MHEATKHGRMLSVPPLHTTTCLICWERPNDGIMKKIEVQYLNSFDVYDQEFHV
eukprot:Ihof_evm9s8 gene=Ihof_evmTU9s8